MNRSFRAQDSQMQQQPSVQRRQQGRNHLGSVMKDKEEELAMFLEMKNREKERGNQLLLEDSEEFDAPIGSKQGGSPIFQIVSSAPTRKTTADDFLNSDNDKNDYDWLLTPPATPLFPSLEMESQKTVMSQFGTPKARSTILKSRLANPQTEPAPRSNMVSRQSTLSPGMNSSSVGVRRPSSSGGRSTTSRPATPTGTPTLPATSKPSRPSRPSTPTSRSTLPSSKSTVPPPRSSTPSARSSTPSARSSTPSARSSTPSVRSSTQSANSSTPPARSSTPTTRSTIPASKPTARSSTPTARPSVTAPKSTARSSTPTGRSTVTASKSTSRSATPTRRPSTPSSSSGQSGPTMTRTAISSASSLPSMKSRPWKPSEMPGYTHDAPPNLRTTMPSRPLSASRGRPGAPSSRSSSVEPGPNGRPRRQSCSPSRGRAPNGGSVHSSRSSVPAFSRAHSNANDNVSPVLLGTQMVDRVVNMRKLAPPKQDDPRSTHNSAGKSSSSLDSSGFGRNLSKKSLDMAMRHMDIRRSIPGSLRPLMTNIPASSMYSVRSGPPRSRTVSVSDSPLATSSNASSEQSINNITLCLNGCEIEEDDLISERCEGRSSPASQCGR